LVKCMQIKSHLQVRAGLLGSNQKIHTAKIAIQKNVTTNFSTRREQVK